MYSLLISVLDTKVLSTQSDVINPLQGDDINQRIEERKEGGRGKRISQNNRLEY